MYLFSNGKTSSSAVNGGRLMLPLLLLGALTFCGVQSAWAANATEWSRVVDDGQGHQAHVFLSVAAEKEFQAQRIIAAGGSSVALAATKTNMLYHGGPVMRNPTSYLIFWQPPGAQPFPGGYQAAMATFINNLSGTPFYDIVTQYYDFSGLIVPNSESLGDSWTDTTTIAPSGCNGSIGSTVPNCTLLDTDIENEVNVALASHPQWLQPQQNVFDAEYFVFTPPNTDECFDPARSECFALPKEPHKVFCAYHSHFSSCGPAGCGSAIYAFLPFGASGGCITENQSPNGIAIDVEDTLLGHEMIEANTDPEANAWFGSDGGDDEIADKCAWNYGYLAPDGTNLVLNGRPFQVQQMWSNEVTECAKRSGPAPEASIPGSLNFGTLNAGASAEMDLPIENAGPGDLNILNLRLASSSATSYSLLNVPPSTATLHSGESLTLKVSYAAPANTGSEQLTGNIVVDTDQTVVSSSATSLTAGVIGSTVSSALKFAAALNFGNVQAGKSKSKKLAVSNTSKKGGATINFSSPAFALAGSPEFSAVNGCFGLAAKKNCTVGVVFRPLTRGPANATLTLQDNASNSPQHISLSGIGK